MTAPTYRGWQVQHAPDARKDRRWQGIPASHMEGAPPLTGATVEALHAAIDAWFIEYEEDMLPAWRTPLWWKLVVSAMAAAVVIAVVLS